MYCVGGSLKNLCHFEMGGGLANADVIRGHSKSMLTVADREEGGRICQNLADVICDRSLTLTLYARYLCSRHALGLKAKRATIGYLEYKI